MFYVYIIKLENGTYYTGFTTNIKRRIKEHKGGKCPTTKRLKYCCLIWANVFSSEITAMKFEKYLKSSSGFAFRNKHLIAKS